MAEASIENSPHTRNKFAVEVEVGGQRVRFTGSVPQGNLDPWDLNAWFLDPIDYKAEKESIRQATQDTGGLMTLPETQSRWYQYGCPVGELNFGPVSSAFSRDLRILGISSNGALFAPESAYKAIRGVGNFLLDELLELADIQGRTVYLNPSDSHSGEDNLDQQQLVEWYKRKGFTGVESRKDLMRRVPQAPRGDRQISRILQNK